jgi:hypothetical protein
MILDQQQKLDSFSSPFSLNPFYRSSVFRKFINSNCLHTSSKAFVTFCAVFAEVSKYISTPARFIQSSASSVSTSRLSI